MAKKSNVHPDYYKTAGREPVGQGTVHEDHRQEFSAAAKKELTERSHRTSKRRVVEPEESGKRSGTDEKTDSHVRSSKNTNRGRSAKPVSRSAA